MTPEVSVIIPTHNRRAMVREAIASVFAQRGASFELIVVDDGSTDGTWDDLKRLTIHYDDRAPGQASSEPLAVLDGEIGALASDPVLSRTEARAVEEAKAALTMIQSRLRNFAATPSEDRKPARGYVHAVQTGHRGPAAARNLGIAMARGALIAFLDSDDLWAPDKLARQSGFMRANPACAIAQTGEIWLRDGRRVNPARRHSKRAGDIFANSLRTCLISPSAVIVRRRLFEEVGGFDEAMAACEDYDLWLRILVRHEVGLLDEPLVTRRAGHPDQLSATVPALDRFRILALTKLLADPSLGAERRGAVAEVMTEKCVIYAQGLERRGRAEDAAFFTGAAGLALGRWRSAPDAMLSAAVARMRAMVKRGETAALAETPTDADGADQ